MELSKIYINSEINIAVLLKKEFTLDIKKLYIVCKNKDLILQDTNNMETFSALKEECELYILTSTQEMEIKEGKKIDLSKSERVAIDKDTYDFFNENVCMLPAFYWNRFDDSNKNM